MEVLLVVAMGLVGGVLGWGIVIGVMYLGSWISYLLGR